jgi:hypothetical protein
MIDVCQDFKRREDARAKNLFNGCHFFGVYVLMSARASIFFSKFKLDGRITQQQRCFMNRKPLKNASSMIFRISTAPCFMEEIYRRALTTKFSALRAKEVFVN